MKSFLGKLSRHFAAPELVDEVVKLPDHLKTKMDTCLEDMSDKSVADAFAMISMRDPDERDVSLTFEHVIDKVIKILVLRKYGKHVQRLVMPFGDRSVAEAKMASVKIATLLSDVTSPTASGNAVAASLLAPQFMLVME